MPLRGEPFDAELARSLQKPEKGSAWVARRESRKEAIANEKSAKAEVMRLDGRCRWPDCANCRAYKPPLEVAHVVRAKGMGGDHGTVSTPAHLMVLDRLTHQQQETNKRDVRPLTAEGTRGPCEFWQWTHADGWFLVARERAPFIYDRD